VFYSYSENEINTINKRDFVYPSNKDMIREYVKNVPNNRYKKDIPDYKSF